MNGRRLIPIVLAGAALAAILMLTVAGDEEGFRLRAELGDAEGIREDYVVRVDGIGAGRVTNVRVTPRDTAVVDITLDPGAGVVGHGATVSARAANLLGEKYLDLTPGDRSRPLPDGALVPLSRTRSEVQLDDILNTLAPTTRARLRILINELGIAIAGRGTDFNALLRRLPGTLRDADALLAQLERENTTLGRLITRADLVLTTLDRRRDTPVRFIRSLESLATTLAAENRALGATIQAAPAALRQTRRSLGRAARTARHLEPAAELVRRAAPALSSTLLQVPPLATSARGTLATARRVAPALTRLGRRGTGDLRRLGATLQRSAAFTAALRPVSEHLGRGGVVAGVLELMQSWDRTINAGDGLGRFFRLRAVVTPSALTSLITRLMPKPARKRPPRPPRPTTVRPSLVDANPGRPPKTPIRVPALVDGIDKTVQRLQVPVQDALEQTQQPLTGLLDYLLK